MRIALVGPGCPTGSRRRPTWRSCPSPSSGCGRTSTSTGPTSPRTRWCTPGAEPDRAVRRPGAGAAGVPTSTTLAAALPGAGRRLAARRDRRGRGRAHVRARGSARHRQVADHHQPARRGRWPTANGCCSSPRSGRRSTSSRGGSTRSAWARSPRPARQGRRARRCAPRSGCAGARRRRRRAGAGRGGRAAALVPADARRLRRPAARRERRRPVALLGADRELLASGDGRRADAAAAVVGRRTPMPTAAVRAALALCPRSPTWRAASLHHPWAFADPADAGDVDPARSRAAALRRSTRPIAGLVTGRGSPGCRGWPAPGRPRLDALAHFASGPGAEPRRARRDVHRRAGGQPRSPVQEAVAAFTAFRAPGPGRRRTPGDGAGVDELHVQAQTAAGSGWFGRRGRMQAVIARLAAYCAVPDRPQAGRRHSPPSLVELRPEHPESADRAACIARPGPASGLEPVPPTPGAARRPGRAGTAPRGVRVDRSTGGHAQTRAVHRRAAGLRCRPGSTASVADRMRCWPGSPTPLRRWPARSAPPTPGFAGGRAIADCSPAGETAAERGLADPRLPVAAPLGGLPRQPRAAALRRGRDARRLLVSGEIAADDAVRRSTPASPPRPSSSGRTPPASTCSTRCAQTAIRRFTVGVRAVRGT